LVLCKRTAFDSSESSLRTLLNLVVVGQPSSAALSSAFSSPRSSPVMRGGDSVTAGSINPPKPRARKTKSQSAGSPLLTSPSSDANDQGREAGGKTKQGPVKVVRVERAIPATGNTKRSSRAVDLEEGRNDEPRKKKDVNLNRGLVQRAVYDMTVWFEIAENSIAVVEDIIRSLRGSRIAHGAARFDWYGRICEQRDALLEIATDFFRLAFKVANDTAYESASHRDSVLRDGLLFLSKAGAVLAWSEHISSFLALIGDGLSPSVNEFYWSADVEGDLLRCMLFY